MRKIGTSEKVEKDSAVVNDGSALVVDEELALQGSSTNDGPKSKPASLSCADNSNKKIKPILFLIAIIGSLGGVATGCDLGGAGATFVMPGFQEHFGWCQIDCTAADQQEIDRDQGLIMGLFGIGATIGSVLSPMSADKFGRRPCMFGASLLFIIGASMQASAPIMTVMFIGRFIAGLEIGALAMSFPVYVTELAPEHSRGALSTMWALSVVGGLLIASACNLALVNWTEGWRLSYSGNIVFAMILMISINFMPESPRWLFANGRDAETRHALSITRHPEEIKRELEELAMECEAEKVLGVASWREVFSIDNKMRYRLLLGIALQSIRQLSGFEAVNFFAPRILKTFFSERTAIMGTLVLEILNFFCTVLTIFIIDEAGRIKLLLVGGVIMVFALIVDAVLSSLELTETAGYFFWFFLEFLSPHSLQLGGAWYGRFALRCFLCELAGKQRV